MDVTRVISALRLVTFGCHLLLHLPLKVLKVATFQDWVQLFPPLSLILHLGGIKDRHDGSQPYALPKWKMPLMTHVAVPVAVFLTFAGVDPQQLQKTSHPLPMLQTTLHIPHCFPPTPPAPAPCHHCSKFYFHLRIRNNLQTSTYHCNSAPDLVHMNSSMHQRAVVKQCIKGTICCKKKVYYLPERKTF